MIVPGVLAGLGLVMGNQAFGEHYYVHRTQPKCHLNNAKLLKAFAFLLMGLACIGWSCTAAVYFSVRSTLQRSSKYSFELHCQSSLSNVSSGSGEPSSVALTPGHATFLREVRTQCVLYSLGYLNVFASHFIIFVYYYTNPEPYLIQDSYYASKPGPFTLILILAIFAPSQGVINALVYNWPRTKDWKTIYPDRSWFYAWKMAFTSNRTFLPKYAPNSRRQLMSGGGQLAPNGRSTTTVTSTTQAPVPLTKTNSFGEQLRDSILSLFHPVTGSGGKSGASRLDNSNLRESGEISVDPNSLRVCEDNSHMELAPEISKTMLIQRQMCAMMSFLLNQSQSWTMITLK